MCEPATIALVSSAVISAYGVYATRENAKDQEKLTKKAAADRADELNDQKSAEANERRRRARIEAGRLRAQAAESGVAGVSIGDILNDVDLQASMDIATLENNKDNAIRGNASATNSRLAGIEQPDYLAAAMNVGLAISNYNQTTRTG